MSQGPRNRILLVPSSKELGVDVIKRITKTDEGAADEHVDWNISNKYYTANVHFHRANWRTLVEALEPGIPAVVVIWEKGEDHEYILGRYTTEWDRLNAEVKLAVAVGSRSIDFDAIENFCSEVGFEFVEVSDDLADDESGNVGLSRVTAALQTIMWPSMQLKEQRRTHRSQASTERAKPVLISTDPEVEIQKEKTKLDAWLDSSDGWPQCISTTSGANAFDDDFSDFVSASDVKSPNQDNARVEAHVSSSQPSTKEPTEEVNHNFHVQDEDEGDYKELLDDDMPTTEEILLTSQRIFGKPMTFKEGDHGDEEQEGGPSDFDLGSIMGALQSMKDEISSITDEEEKRKAAARVALGLVWGLEGGRGM